MFWHPGNTIHICLVYLSIRVGLSRKTSCFLITCKHLRAFNKPNGKKINS